MCGEDGGDLQDAKQNGKIRSHDLICTRGRRVLRLAAWLSRRSDSRERDRFQVNERNRYRVLGARGSCDTCSAARDHGKSKTLNCQFSKTYFLFIKYSLLIGQTGAGIQWRVPMFSWAIPMSFFWSSELWFERSSMLCKAFRKPSPLSWSPSSLYSKTNSCKWKANFQNERLSEFSIFPV